MPTVFLDSASAALAKGDNVCLISDAAGMAVVTKAVGAALSVYGFVWGIATAAAGAGTRVPIQTSGRIDSATTGLAAGNAGRVRCNTTTGRCERVTAFSTGDYPVGFVDAAGYMGFEQGLAVGSAPGNPGATDTRASVQAIQAPSNGLTLSCAEVSAAYKFNSASVATADGWTVLTANDATPGRWELQGDTISLVPIGGTSDDWPRLFGSSGVSAAMAYKGKIILRPGTWLCKTNQNIVDGVNIEGSAGVTIISSLTPTGTIASVFCAYRNGGASSAISSNAAVGATTIAATTDIFGSPSPSAPVDVEIGSGLRYSYNRIVGKSGGGPYTLTLERPIVKSFTAGTDTITLKSPPRDIRVIGNGMRISGTGDRAAEISGGERCLIDGLRVDTVNGAFSEITMSLDIGAYRSTIRNCIVQGSASSPASQAGIAIESAERCAVVDCVAYGYAGTGGAVSAFALIDCDHCVIERCTAYGSFFGLQLTTGGSTFGCRDCIISDCLFMTSGSHGILVCNGSLNNRFRAVKSIKNTGAGLYITGGFANSGQTYLSSFEASDNSGDGIQTSTTGGGILANGIVCDRNTLYGMNLGVGDSVVNQYSSTDCVSGPFQITGAANLYVSGFSFTKTINGLWLGALGGTGRLSLVDGRISFAGTGTSALVDIGAAGILYIADVVSSGGGTLGVNANHAVACKIHRGPGVDLSSCGTPWNIDATARANFGTVVLNGTTGVVVNGYFLADQPIALSFNVLGGTQGAYPTISSKGANTFTVKGTAADTSTYDWRAV